MYKHPLEKLHPSAEYHTHIFCAMTAISKLPQFINSDPSSCTLWERSPAPHPLPIPHPEGWRSTCGAGSFDIAQPTWSISAPGCCQGPWQRPFATHLPFPVFASQSVVFSADMGHLIAFHLYRRDRRKVCSRFSKKFLILPDFYFGRFFSISKERCAFLLGIFQVSSFWFFGRFLTI